MILPFLSMVFLIVGCLAVLERLGYYAGADITALASGVEHGLEHVEHYCERICLLSGC